MRSLTILPRKPGPTVEALSMIFRRQRDIKEPRLKLLLLETRPLKHDHANQPHRDASV
jgi:hypothetical protein